jgi:DnaJ like chaperone protein
VSRGAVAIGDRIRRSPHPVGLATVTLLAWIALADGEIDLDEERRLTDYARKNPDLASEPNLTHLLRTLSDTDLAAACDVLRSSLGRKEKRLFLEMALGMALADRFLTPAENQVLRFVADLFSLSPRRFRRLFQGVTACPLPDPPDLSSSAWWRQAQAQRRRAPRRPSGRGRQGSSTVDLPSRCRDLTRPQALRILGLASGASQVRVKRAYRRLARIHHPDRFHSLGPEAVEAASLTFRRIQEAYAALSSP